MKKIILTICLLSLVCFSFAQGNKKGFSLSLKSGITFANMYGQDVKSETFLNGDNPENFYANDPASNVFKLGDNFGLLLDYRFNQHISLGIGTSYIQKGAKINVNRYWNSEMQTYVEVKGKTYWNQSFWTLEIPLTIYLPLQQNDIYFQVGIFTGFLINSEEKGNIKISGKEYEYVNNRIANGKEPGYFLRGGYIFSLPNNKGSIFGELSWSRSIKTAGSGIIPNPQYYYNQTISINIGYRYHFNFTKK